MGFKLADLFVSISAQTSKYSQQMAGVKRTALETGQQVGQADFSGAGDQLAEAFSELPQRIASAFSGLAPQITKSLAGAIKPAQAETARAASGFTQLLGPIAAVGGTLLKSFRWDLLVKGLDGLKAGAQVAFAGATGDAAKFGSVLNATIDVATIAAKIGKVRHEITTLLSPSRLIGAAILIPARGALQALGKGVDLAFSNATGKAAVLGVALKSAINLGVGATRSQALQRALGATLAPARRLGQLLAYPARLLARGTVAAVRFGTGLNAAKGAATGLKNVMSQIVIASGFVAIGYKIVSFFKGAISGASHLAETIDKVDAVLGDSAPAVKAFADDMANKFGLVKRTTLDAASGFAGLAKGLGQLKGDKLTDFSIKMTKLSMDFASFADIDFEDAQKSIKIGLTGEPSDVLKQFGVIVNEETTKQYALAHGIGKVNGALTQQEKLMARQGLITQQLADATDNLEITQGSTANMARKASGQFINFATAVGTVLLPVVNRGISLFSQFTGFISRTFESNKPAIEGFVETMSVGFEFIGSIFRNWRASFEVARLGIVQGLLNLGEYFDVLGQNISIIASYIGEHWYSLIRDGLHAALAAAMNFAKNIQALGTAIGEFLADPTRGFKVDWTPMLDGFEATAAKLPALIKPHLTDMSDQIAAAGKPILDDIARRTAKVAPGKVPKGVPVDQAENEKEAKKGAIVDLQGFANSLQEAVNGKTALAERQARAQERTAKATEQLVSMRTKPNQAMVGGPAWGAAGMA